MSDRLNILILHRMGNPATWRESVAELELAFPRYAPEHNYLVHNAVVPLPKWVQEFEFDAIILNSTFLSNVFSPERFFDMKKYYAFLKSSTAFKIALPQDDYYCSEEIDSLMLEWKIDLLHTVCPNDWNILYPQFMAHGGNIQLGYTGYITPQMRQRTCNPKHRNERQYDVVYRASGKPSFPNKLATEKAELGNKFLTQFSHQPWNMDISNAASKTIHGPQWWDFIENSRCVLGANSGSSNLIRNHCIVWKIRNYIEKHPLANDDDVICACLPVQDREVLFTAISPRVLEAGLLKTVQLLVPGTYSGILKPWEDYIPLESDCSNLRDIEIIVEDKQLQERIAQSCRDKMLSTPDIQIENLIDRVVDQINAHASSNRPQGFALIHKRYHEQITYDLFWYYHAVRVGRKLKPYLPEVAVKVLRQWSARLFKF